MNKIKTTLCLLPFTILSQSAFACFVPPQKIGNTGLWATAHAVVVGDPGEPGSKTYTKNKTLHVEDKDYSVVFVSDKTTPKIPLADHPEIPVKEVNFNAVVIVDLQSKKTISITKILDRNAPAMRSANEEGARSTLSFGKTYKQGSCSVEESTEEE